MVGTSSDGMTAFKASLIRAERIRTEQSAYPPSNSSNMEKPSTHTFDSLFECYLLFKSIKAVHQDESRYRKHIKPSFGKRSPESIEFQEFQIFKQMISKGSVRFSFIDSIEFFCLSNMVGPPITCIPSLGTSNVPLDLRDF